MKSKKVTFLDGSYIEENESGLIYVGEIANACGHIIRKSGCSLEVFMIAFNEQVAETTQKLRDEYIEDSLKIK